MEIGDICYCFNNRYNSNYDIVHKENTLYKILYIGENLIKLEIEKSLSDNHYFYTIYDDVNCYYFHSHFLTKKQYRRKKLQKINYDSTL